MGRANLYNGRPRLKDGRPRAGCCCGATPCACGIAGTFYRPGQPSPFYGPAGTGRWVPPGNKGHGRSRCTRVAVWESLTFQGDSTLPGTDRQPDYVLESRGLNSAVGTYYTDSSRNDLTSTPYYYSSSSCNWATGYAIGSLPAGYSSLSLSTAWGFVTDQTAWSGSGIMLADITCSQRYRISDGADLESVTEGSAAISVYIDACF